MSSPPHEFSSCPQCTRSQVMPAVRCRVWLRGLRRVSDCRVRVLTRSRVGTCGGKLAAWREPATLVVFLRGFEPTLPGQSFKPGRLPRRSWGCVGSSPDPHRPAPAHRVTLSSRLSLVSGSRPPTPRRARRSCQPLSSSALHRLVCPPNWLWVPLCHQAVLGVHVASRGEPGDEKGPRERARRAAGV